MTEAQRLAEYFVGRSLPICDSHRIPCPVHGGKDQNAVISHESGRTLFYCHSHRCSFYELVPLIPSYLWDSGSYIPRIQTPSKREPEPLTIRGKETKYTSLAEEIWVSASEPLDEVRHHAYCRAKGFDYHYGARQGRMPKDLYPLKAGDSLLVLKMQDEQDIFTGVQVIAEREDDKGFIKRTFGSTGMMPLGLFDLKAGRFLVVEGWATGVAAKQLFPWATPLIAFGSNLDRIAELWQRRFPDAAILLVPDDSQNRDLWDLKNAPSLRAELAQTVEKVEGAFHAEAA
jgi:phage/plasmid primase-like uncharacterized protein